MAKESNTLPPAPLRLVSRRVLPQTLTRPAAAVPLGVRIAQIKDDIHTLELLAIAASVHGCVFSAAELLEQARLDPDLQYVLRDAVTPKQVGRCLVRLAVRAGRGVRLVRIGRNEDGCLWACEIQADAGLLPEPGA